MSFKWSTKVKGPLLGRKASEAMKLIKVQYENILAMDSIVKKERDET